MASNDHHRISHILFDLDGTLINSTEKLADIVDDLLAEKGLKITQRIMDYIPNLTSLLALNEVIREETGLVLERREFLLHILRDMPKRNLQLMPGVEKLVKHLKAQGVLMAVASGSLKTYFDAIQHCFGTFFKDYFTHIVMAYDDPEIVNKKPHPDVYHMAVKRFPTAPHSIANVLIFEDSITGLKGALQSGAPVVLVGKFSDQLRRDNAELIAKATLVIESMEQFQPEVFGLPPF